MLMTQHVSAGLARAWRAQAAQQGLPAAPASPRDPARSEADGHLMSQQLGAATPLTQADARTSPLDRAPRGAPGVRRAHARSQPRPRPAHQLWGGTGERPAPDWRRNRGTRRRRVRRNPEARPRRPPRPRALTTLRARAGQGGAGAGPRARAPRLRGAGAGVQGPGRGLGGTGRLRGPSQAR